MADTLRSFTIQGVIDVLTHGAEADLKNFVKTAEVTSGGIVGEFQKIGLAAVKIAGPAGIAAIGAGFALAAAEVVKYGTEIHDVMARFQADTVAAGAQVGQVRDAIEGAASRTTRSMSEIGAESERIFQSFGDLGNRTEEVTEQFLTFAVAAKSNAAESVDNLRNVMQAFGVSLENVTALSDKLIYTQKLTGQNANQLAASLSHDSALFKELGIGLDQATGLLAEFGKKGIDAQVLLAGMTHALAAADQNSAQFQDAWTTLGVAIDQGTGKIAISAADAFGVLMGKLRSGKMTAEETSAAMEILGKRGFGQFALGASDSQQAFDALVKTIQDKSRGASDEARKMQEATFGAQWQLMYKSHFEPAISAMGNAFEWLATHVLHWVDLMLGDLETVGQALGRMSVDAGSAMKEVVAALQDQWHRFFAWMNQSIADMEMRLLKALKSLPQAVQQYMPGFKAATSALEMDVKQHQDWASAQNAQVQNLGLGSLASFSKNAGAFGTNLLDFLSGGLARNHSEYLDQATKLGLYTGTQAAVPFSSLPKGGMSSVFAQPGATAAAPAASQTGVGAADAMMGMAAEAAKPRTPTEIITALDQQTKVLDHQLKMGELTKQQYADQLAKVYDITAAEKQRLSETQQGQEELRKIEEQTYEARRAAEQDGWAVEMDHLSVLEAKHQAGANQQLAMLDKELRSTLLTADEREKKETERGLLLAKIADSEEAAQRQILDLTGATVDQRLEALRLQERDMANSGVSAETISKFDKASRDQIRRDELKSEQALKDQILQNDGETTAARLKDLEIQRDDYMRTIKDKALVEQWFNSQVRELARQRANQEEELRIQIEQIVGSETDAKRRQLEIQKQDLIKAGNDKVQVAQWAAAQEYQIWENTKKQEDQLLNQVLQAQGQGSKVMLRQLVEEVTNARRQEVSEETISLYVEQKKLEIEKAITAEAEAQNKAQKSSFSGGGMTIQEAFGKPGDTTQGAGTAWGGTGIFAPGGTSAGGPTTQAQVDQTISSLNVQPATTSAAQQAANLDQQQATMQAGLAGGASGTERVTIAGQTYIVSGSLDDKAQQLRSHGVDEASIANFVQQRGGGGPAGLTDAAGAGSIGGGLAAGALAGLTSGQSGSGGGTPGALPGASPTAQPNLQTTQKVQVEINLTGEVKVADGNLSQATVDGILGDTGILQYLMGDGTRNGRA